MVLNGIQDIFGRGFMFRLDFQCTVQEYWIHDFFLIPRLIVVGIPCKLYIENGRHLAKGQGAFGIVFTLAVGTRDRAVVS